MQSGKEPGMFETALHLGTEHPSMLLLGASSLLAFGVGTGLGLYARLKSVDETSEPVSEPTEQ
jgi:hypothetical protein